MKTSIISYKIANWSMLVIGFFHTATYLTAPKTSEQLKIMETMDSLTFPLLGSEANILSFYQGFCLMMGLLLIGYSLLNIISLKNSDESNVPANILVLNIIVTFFSVAISLKYFFLIPVIFTSISFTGYVVSLSTRSKKLGNHKK